MRAMAVKRGAELSESIPLQKVQSFKILSNNDICFVVCFNFIWPSISLETSSTRGCKARCRIVGKAFHSKQSKVQKFFPTMISSSVYDFISIWTSISLETSSTRVCAMAVKRGGRILGKILTPKQAQSYSLLPHNEIFSCI
jgi:hypothetical protein